MVGNLRQGIITPPTVAFKTGLEADVQLGKCFGEKVEKRECDHG